MAKATFTLPNGTKVTIDGSTEEVTNLLENFSQPTKSQKPKKELKTARKKSFGKNKKVTVGATVLISELAAEGYFKSKRGLADVHKKLEEKGHIFPRTSISPALLLLTKQRVLRRLKEKKKWIYVQ